MRRAWILFKTEFNAWRHDPITALGGILPPSLILIAFTLLFGGRLSFKVAVVNKDLGPYGSLLRQTFDEVISPLNDEPYYFVLDMQEKEALRAFEEYRIDGVWVIPPDFSVRLEAGDEPKLDMYLNNYNDDRAKNHRIYAAEILWHFYERIGLPPPPLEIAEVYPRPEMVDWVSVIAVGVTLLSVCLGGIFNIYTLTYKERINNLTLEFGSAPRSLAWVLTPKILLALVFGLASGTAFLLVIRVWSGFWPGRLLWDVWLLAGLTACFWIGLAVVFGLVSRNYMGGAVAIVLTAIIVFFIGGGLGLVRYNREEVPWFSWLFPNTHAIDPIRDMVLFQTWPSDWNQTLLILSGFAVTSLAIGTAFAARKLRQLD
jgi:ABC-type multidrug transport system permease subunit